MTDKYQYRLEKGSRKHQCPGCGKQRFVRYVDLETDVYLPGQYGRCDRESKCSYHLNPYSDGYSKNASHQSKNTLVVNLKNMTTADKSNNRKTNEHQLNPEPVFIPIYVLKSTLQGYDQNRFLLNLETKVPFPFDPTDIERMVKLYFLGTVVSGHTAGAVTLPFIDYNQNVRAIQEKLFDGTNHTAKVKYATSWTHSRLKHSHNSPKPQWVAAYESQKKLVSCFFGEHLLLRYPCNPVALVEAPKTAIYGALYFGFPDNPGAPIWLAAGAKSYFNYDRAQMLKGRDVIVFPDLSTDGGTYDQWLRKAQYYQSQMPGTRFIVSDFLEQHASEKDKQMGLDLADYLIRQDWQRFRKPRLENESHKEPQPDINLFVSESCEKSEKCELTETKKIFSQKTHREISVDGSEEIKELEAFFLKRNLPPGPLQLNQYTKIIDPTKFVDAHIITLKAYEGKRIGEPVYDRLKQLKQLLTHNSN